ncbi:biotin--[acetyl-CoA-carboxylase] ligase [Antarcticimicrobium luteum]|uniref:biotin--[biotin carboxyl-carrier protein] ligase n=1 Tax=Antarcticimicrobium luteum TaxID=2547397 RepID=A0A4R5UVD2_9RHOB|nr:biotin--[acetyl-CoA-carboxylase] ligase [Antarcticimicrobium luteum]TDK43035.1 biotin--[acetyl-CoA-carboxylase] ligase [Antarcticimicrobium luteum]
MTDWPDGYGRRLLDEVDSTLNEAARIAPGLAGPEWILARHQTAARGRRGRGWASPAGNFSATLVLRLNGPAQHAALRSFVAALALFDACVAVTGRPEAFSLKWPNDVLLNGGKLAGILLESAGVAGGAMPLFIGIGVNLAEAPPADAVEARALRPVSLAGETGMRIAPEAFLTELAAAFARYEAQFAAYGFAPIREAWLSRAARLGQPVTARTGTSETRGTFETVDAEGQLVLMTPAGRVRIPAADVFF